VRVAAANGDQDKINAIYAEYDGMGYTDPDKLSATLQTVQLNQEQLDQQLKDAVSSESSNTELLTAELDTTTNGSENSVTSIADNQDAQLTTNNVFTQNEDNSTTSYFV